MDAPGDQLPDIFYRFRFRSFFLFSARSDVYFSTPPFFPAFSTRPNADEFVRTQNRAESCRFFFTGRSPPTPESSSIPTVPVLLSLLLLLLFLVLLLSAITPLSVFVPYFRTCIIFLANQFGVAQRLSFLFVLVSVAVDLMCEQKKNFFPPPCIMRRTVKPVGRFFLSHFLYYRESSTANKNQK
ncbi:hypothetical protein IscW_ISCW018131 [Ixodes scapularis]|uniref:Transmembrane protein n=1 Tax=Ixodes scapularis TaxID=6945 RepID=B7PEK2_IXOSC|nr:hypothetical protein IscW_ISCW018131 [Ixodes scapularis]|eukprot:XP_002433624.1 hypothetical protein IscW_ISCW018131 [Ixodes scapularis]